MSPSFPPILGSEPCIPIILLCAELPALSFFSFPGVTTPVPPPCTIQKHMLLKNQYLSYNMLFFIMLLSVLSHSNCFFLNKFRTCTTIPFSCVVLLLKKKKKYYHAFSHIHLWRLTMYHAANHVF